MGSIVSSGFDIAAAEETKKGGGMVPQFPKRSLKEKLVDNSTLDILFQERLLVNDALAQGAALQPEMFRALGYEPIFADEGGGTEELNAAANSLGELEDQGRLRSELQAQLKELRPGKGRNRRHEGRNIKKERRAIRKQLNKLPRGKALQKATKRARENLAELQSVPRRIIGVEPTAASDPTGSAGGKFRSALDLQNESLDRALRGDLPIDPTLIRSFDERERALREQLRRQFGQDFESADAAREILSNFDRERSEAYQQFNREQIITFSGLTERRAGALDALTRSRLEQLQEPVKAQLVRGGALSAVIQDTGITLGRRDARRQQLFDAQQAQFQDRAFNTAMRAAGLSQEGEAIGDIVNTLIAAAAGGAGAGALGAGGGALGGAGGGGGGLAGFASKFGQGLQSQAIAQSQTDTKE